MKILQIFVLFIVLMATSHARQLLIDDKRRAVSQGHEVAGIGEYVLLESDTVADGYLKAESLAKAAAVKSSGQYFEVLKIKDSSTGESKEIVASIAGSVSTFTVTERNMSTINGQLVATVEVSAKATRAQLDTAIKRYMNNAEYKEQITSLKKNAALLQKALKRKERLVNNLREQVGNISETKKLNKHLRYAKKEIADLAVIYGESISRAHSVSEFFDGNEITATADMLGAEVEKSDAIYLSRINNVLEKMKYAVAVDKTVNLVNNVVDVHVSPDIRVESPDAVKKLLPEMKRDMFWQMPLEEKGGTKIVPFQLDGSPMGVVARRYSIVYVVEVNDQRREFPILMPFETKFDKGFSQRSRVDRFTGKFDRNNRCHYGGLIKNNDKLDDILCFNYVFNENTVNEARGITYISGSYRIPKELSFAVPIGDDIFVDTYMEVREVGSQEALFKKRY